MNCRLCHEELPATAVYCPCCGHWVEGTVEYKDYVYEAFISYRHLPKDRRLAKRLERAIEGFRIPRPLRKPDGPARLGKLFRDEDELPTSDSLSDQITDALARSRYLFVVCSPQTRESIWVQQEVRQFAALHGRNHIRLALVDGEPDESFPPLLLSRKEVDEEGFVSEVPTEPLAADFREGNHKTFHNEVLRLIAPLVGCDYDDLRQRERQRNARLVSAAAAVVTAVSTIFGSFSLYQQRQIERNYRAVQVRESEMLAERSEQLTDQGDRYQAIQVALAALPDEAVGSSRPFVPAAQVALERALGVYPEGGWWRSRFGTTDISSSTEVRAHSNQGLFAMVGLDGRVVVWELDTGDVLCRIDVRDELGVASADWPSKLVAMAFSGDRLMCVEERRLVCFDVKTGQTMWKRALEGDADAFAAAASKDESQLAVLRDGESYDDPPALELVDPGDGSQTAVIPLSKDLKYNLYDAQLSFDETASAVAFATDELCVMVDLATKEAHQVALLSGEAISWVESLSWVDGKVCVGLGDGFGAVHEELRVFDRELNLLWQKETPESLWLNEEGIDLAGHVGVFGAKNLEGHEHAQLVAALGNTLLVLDAETGAETARVEESSPILACHWISKSIVAVCLAEGRISLFMPEGGAYADAILSPHDIPNPLAGDFVEVDREVYLAYVSRTGGPVTLRVVALDRENNSTGIGIEALQSATSVRGWNTGGETLLVGKTDDEIVVVRANDPTNVTHILLKDLAGIDSEKGIEIAPSLSGQSLFVYNDWSRDGTTICECSVTTGEVLGQTSVDGRLFFKNATADVRGRRPIEEFAQQDGTRALFLASDVPRVVSVGDGRVLASFGPEGASSSESPQNAWYAGESVVLMYDEELRVYNTKTGEERACDLAKYWPDYGDADALALSEDRTRLALLCDDGAVRLFDTSDGSLLWETDAVYGLSTDYLCIASAVGDVLLQDKAGTLVLLSGKDGSSVTATTTLPRIDASWQLDQPGLLAVHCDGATGMLTSSHSVAVIQLDPDAFGVTSHIAKGRWLSGDGRLAFCKYDYVELKPRVVDHYTLGELLTQAHETVEGHELTAAERNRYHVDG